MRKVTLVFCLFSVLMFSFSSVYAGRYYQPEIARWATPDPALQKMHPNELVKLQNGQLLSTSPYVYTYDNPLKYVDPDGELPQWVVGAVVGGGLDLALQLAVEGKSFSEVSWARVGGSAVLGGVGGGLLSKGGKLVSYLRHGTKVDDALNVADDVVNLADDVGNVADDATRGVVQMESASSRVLGFTEKSLQKGFTKHGADFGLTGNWNPGRAVEFSRAINQHINSAGVKTVTGTYRGTRVTHYVNPKTGLNVTVDQSGNYMSGWRLSAEQLESVLTSGRLF